MTAKRKKQFFKPRWKDHFTFSLRERRGFYLLSVLLFIEVGVLYYMRYVHEPGLPEDWSRIVLVGDSLLRVVAVSDSAQEDSGIANGIGRNTRTSSLFPFDPNTLNTAGWRRLGLSPKQAAAIVRFRDRGMVFRSKRDLMKIKVVDPAQIISWLPYAQLPDSLPVKNKVRSEKKTEKLDIGAADSASLVQLRGIGPVLAGRIVRYRNRLGGFLMLDQVREVYGVDDSVWTVLLPQVHLLSGGVRQYLTLNSMPEDSLRMHPYVGSKMARQICTYRKQHSFRSVDELQSLPLVTGEIYRKIVPYLKLH